MDIQRLRELIDLVASARVAEIDMVENGARVRIVPADGNWRPTGTDAKAVPTGSAVPVTAAAGAAPTRGQDHAGDVADIRAPMFGVLHLAPAPDAPPFVTIGDRIESGRQLCLIEAMKMFHPVHAEQGGTLAAVLAAAGAEVELGQPLFRLAPPA